MTIESEAHEVLTRFWEAIGKPEVARFFPVDSRQLIKSVMGWDCEAKDLVAIDARPGFSVLGRCMVYEDGRRLVEVATLEVGSRGMWSSPAVQRWTWAHEAGHIALKHISRSGTVDHDARVVHECRRARSVIGTREPTRNREEVAAHVFAGALLMPEKAFRGQFRERFGNDEVWANRAAYSDLLSSDAPPDGPSAADLAKQLATQRGESGESLCDFFGVSREAGGRRLVELGLVFS